MSNAPSKEAMGKQALIKSKTAIQPHQAVELPSGGIVLMRVPTGKDYRDWKAYLNDEKGEVIRERAKLADELLVASILVEPSGEKMFTRDEVMSGALDEILQLDLEAMKDAAYGLYGQRSGFKLVTAEDREKNS